MAKLVAMPASKLVARYQQRWLSRSIASADLAMPPHGSHHESPGAERFADDDFRRICVAAT